jgi:hypothetical protein
MLKIFPAGPVETEAMTPLPRVMEVDVPIRTFCPPLTVTRLALPEVREAKVLVPVPPRAADKTPAQAKVKALFEIVPWMLVSLLTKPTKVEPKVEDPVPPLATGKIPVTSEVKDTKPLNKAPATDLTTPVPRELRVVEPVMDRVPTILVVARKELPETVMAVEEAFCRLACPEALRVVKNVAPDTVKPVLDAVAKVDCPVTLSAFRKELPETVRAVVEALVEELLMTLKVLVPAV